MAILPPDPVFLLRGPDTGPVHCLLFRVSPYVEHLYAGAESGTVHIWDLRKSRETSRLVVGPEPCLALRSILDETLVTQGKNGTYKVWKADGSNWIHEETLDSGHISFCRCQTLSSDQILIPLENSVIGALSLKTLDVAYKLDPHQVSSPKALGEVMSFKPLDVQGKKLVIVAYESGQIAVWDLNARNILSWFSIEECPLTVDFDVNLMRGIVGSVTDKLQAFNLTKAHTMSLKSTIPLKNAGTSVAVIRPDTKVFAAGGWDGRLRIFSFKTLRPLAVLDQHKTSVHDIAYSDCKVEAWGSKCLMAAAGKDGAVSLWDLYNN
ncbi:guanine nucleotide-binding protein subunit beta-like protein 1 [Neodiprion pinetum]|uniref:Guanine nucleotide-binding protein subunit beta-like protein 1 n=1 Tax=Neodiprion lecontei TaxID=441921 RepID=A0A6J0C1C5_NEOLC|nr:guanine nucleotide-binding protein subunit beta-like protein 1 [Neodiprion lecontei]XP_046475273.1 guanine nucleotide-binding protein subunit beta-like protein 1 [Neodiprion pinetum]XP_046610079.1 guanine nucleotide-binding protein subunit beta-like protein 1 [Neodiprion virginianus]